MAKQYVNLSMNLNKPEEGASVVLKTSINEKNPGDSEGGVGYFYVDPQGGVMAHDMFPAHMRPQGFDKDPKYQVEASIEKKQMQEPVRIGSGAGDSYKFKYGKEADGSDAKSYPGDALDVWRKVFVRMGNMKGFPALDLGLIKPDYDPVFIEFEADGGSKEITHYNCVFNMDPIIAEVDAGQGPPAHGGQTVTVAVVDRIASAALLEMCEQVWPARSALGRAWDWLAEALTGKQKLKWVVPNGKLTWADDKWWIKELNAVMHEKDGTETKRALAAPDTILLKDTRYTHFSHPEGPTCRKVMVEMVELQKQLKTMMTVNTKKVTLEARIYAIDSAFLGLASGGAPKLMVATRDAMYGNKFPSGAIAKTLVHELGHIFGLVPRYLPVYSEDKAEAQDPEENGKWYEGKGGLGSHCGEGASEVQGTISGQPAMVMSGGSCIMFHAGDEEKPLTFCGGCQTLLKRADLMTLGKAMVWPKGWTK